jgi:hypothetical protein
MPLKNESGKTFRKNVVNGDSQRRPQGRVDEWLDESKRHKWQRL